MIFEIAEILEIVRGVRKPLDISKYREIFKSEYTRAVMSGADVRAGIFAGSRAVRKAVGDDDRAFEVMAILRARLGDVLGVGQ